MCVFTPLPTLETKFSNENGNSCTTEVNYSVMFEPKSVSLIVMEYDTWGIYLYLETDPTCPFLQVQSTYTFLQVQT